MVTLTEQIRSAVGRRIEGARREGRSTLNIVSGDIVRELHLKNRTPAVCQVLASKKLEDENGVRLERKTGPPSGQSTTMEYTYRIVDVDSVERPFSTLWALKGSAKELYESLGGGEAFLKKEREDFDRP